MSDPTPITPETLTRELVDSLLERAHPNGEAPDPNHPPDRALAAAIRVWLRWDSDGRDRNEYNARLAARTICDRLNSLPKDTARPVTQEALDLLRAQVASGGSLTAGQAAILFDHLDWQCEELERISEERDSYRDQVQARATA